MKFWERIGIAIMSAWGLFAVHQGLNALMKAHNWQPLNASDWGTWAGAIGTVATLVWTVRLATAESRKRKRDELLLARLHGASMVLRLVHAEALVSAVCRTLDVASRTPIQLTADHLLDMSRKLDNISIWQMNDLVPLIPLPDNTAVKLAQVADQVSTAKKLFAQTIADYQRLSNDERANFAQTLYTPMAGTHRFLMESVNTCHEGAQALHLAQA